MALGALAAAKPRGLPVIGYGNSQLAKSRYLDMSSVNNRSDIVGVDVANALLARIQDLTLKPGRKLIEPALVARGTTTRVSGREAAPAAQKPPRTVRPASAVAEIAGSARTRRGLMAARPRSGELAPPGAAVLPCHRRGRRTVAGSPNDHGDPTAIRRPHRDPATPRFPHNDGGASRALPQPAKLGA